MTCRSLDATVRLRHSGQSQSVSNRRSLVASRRTHEFHWGCGPRRWIVHAWVDAGRKYVVRPIWCHEHRTGVVASSDGRGYIMREGRERVVGGRRVVMRGFWVPRRRVPRAGSWHWRRPSEPWRLSARAWRLISPRLRCSHNHSSSSLQTRVVLRC